MNEEDLVETNVVPPTETDEEKTAREAKEASEAGQDPLKPELERVKSKRTPAEKLLFTKKRVDSQLQELGLLPKDEDSEEENDDDKPLTIGEYKRNQARDATKTALQMADDITNETERELVKHHIENTIRSTGNPKEDFRLAQGLVNAEKNRLILEEQTRKPGAKTHPTGSGAPAKIPNQEDEISVEERAFMQPPFNLTKAQILEARKKEQASQR